MPPALVCRASSCSQHPPRVGVLARVTAGHPRHDVEILRERHVVR